MSKLENLISLNRYIVLLQENSKIPLSEEFGWNHKTPADLDVQKLEAHQGNYAIKLEDEDLIIDVDARNGGLSSIIKLFDKCQITLNPSVLTASNGFHYYLNKPASFKIKKSLKEYQGIDFLSAGAYVVVPPSLINNNNYRYIDSSNHFKREAPISLLQELEHKLVVQENEPFNLLSVEQIEAVLSDLDPSCSYEQWIKIGMALKRFNEAEGLRLWKTWSSKSPKYKEYECEYKWSTFTSHPNAVTPASLFYLAKNSNASELKEFETLEDTKPTLTKERKTWVDEFVYVNSHRAYCYLKTLDILKTEAFNLFAYKFLPDEYKNCKRVNSASYLVQREFPIKFVSQMLYLPNMPSGVINYKGQDVLNTFVQDTLPKVKKSEYSSNWDTVLQDFERHCKILCNNEQNARILIDWIAFNVQNPGYKILWSPVIQSIQGVGKSFFVSLLQLLLHYKNVGVVSPKSVISTFNPWATGVCVNILEEIRIKGQNRYEIINALKPMITDKYIEIHSKGINPFNVPNVTNYICFTNFKDAIPVSSDDRRWWFISCEIDSLDDVSRIVNKSVTEYYNYLFNTLETHASDYIKYFNEYQVSQSFLELKHAPMSDSKLLAISTAEDETEFLQEVRDVLHAGGKYYCKECFSTYHLLNACMTLIPEFVRPNTRSCGLLFRALGYQKFFMPLTIDNRSCYIWVKRVMTKAQVKQALNIQ